MPSKSSGRNHMRTTQKRAGREDEPEAVEKHGAERERHRERERVEHAHAAAETRERDADDHRADRDVHRLPELHLAHAHEHLRVHGLRQRVVELPVLHLLDQPHHVRLDRPRG